MTADDLRQKFREIGSWNRDKKLRRRLTSVGHLLTGNFVSALVGMLAFMLTARALGTVDYGILALTYSYVRAIDRFVNFQSWQPLIKFAAGMSEDAERKDDLKALFKYGLLLDAAAAACAWVIAIVGVVIADFYFNWSDRTIEVVMLYSVVLLVRINGMPTAVLRLARRFQLMAYGQLLNAAIRLVLCLIAYLAGGGLFAFALIWIVTQAVGSIFTIVIAVRTLRQQGLGDFLSASLRSMMTRFPGLWNFTWSSNVIFTIRSSTQDVDTLLVGALADPSSAGLYHIAKRIGRMTQQVGVQVQTVLYPDIARYWARNAFGEFRKAILQVEVILAAFGLFGFVFFFFLAEPLLRLTAGPHFVDAAPLIVVQVIAVSLFLSGTALRTGLLAMGRQREILWIAIGTTVLFYLTALILIPEIGAMGANIAHVVLAFAWLISLNVAFKNAMQHKSERSQAPVAAQADTLADDY